MRQKERLQLGQRGCSEALQWSLFTAAQDERLQSIVPARLVQRLNGRRRQVLELQRDLLAMVQARSAEHLVGEVADGRVSGVQSYGFFVEVGETRVEGLVHVSSLNDDWYEYRSRQNRLVGQESPGLSAGGSGSGARDQGGCAPQPDRPRGGARADLLHGAGQFEWPRCAAVRCRERRLTMHPYVLAVTGASAQPLAERTLQLLMKAGRSVHLVLSKGAYAVFKAEQGLTIPMEPNRQAVFWRGAACLPGR